MNKSRHLDTTSLAALAFYYSQNKMHFHKTLFFVQSVDGRLAYSMDFSFITIKFAKKRKLQKPNVEACFLPPPGDFAYHPYTYFTWVLLMRKSCIVEVILSSRPQLSLQRERVHFLERRQAERECGSTTI